jgi:hypothetical protein
MYKILFVCALLIWPGIVNAPAVESPVPQAKPGISLTLIPPSPVTDQIILDIRGAVRNNSNTGKTYHIAIYLDEEKPEKRLHQETVEVQASASAGVRFRWPTKGQAGQHEVLMIAVSGKETARTGRPLQVLASSIRSTKRVDGAWCSFNLPEMREGLIYDPVLRQMTDDQWREMVRGMHGIGMDIIVIQESAHWHRHNTDGQSRYAADDFSAKSFYPSGLFTNRMPMASSDPIEAILSESDKLGMYVFFGVGLFAWFDFTPASLLWHQKVAGELWEHYGHHPSFYGWYVSEEKDGSLGNETERRQIVDFFRLFTPYVRRLAPDKPVMLAPNCFHLRGAEETYRKLLPHVDILCPFGFHRIRGGLTGEEAATLLQALCDETGAHLWMDMEIFLFNKQGALIPRPIGGLVSDLLRFPNFEKIICYQYPGLMNAPEASIKPGGDPTVKLYRDYQRYLEGGVSERGSHVAVGKPIVCVTKTAPPYSGFGNEALTDGQQATDDFQDVRWLGYKGANLDATIDLGEVMEVRHLITHYLKNSRAGIHLPATVEYAISSDNKEFKVVSTVRPAISSDTAVEIVKVEASLKNIRGRYVRVRAINAGTIPVGQPGGGKPSWLFVDEIIVNPSPRPGQKGKPVEIVCHRGANKLAPENVLVHRQMGIELID